jgi:hypothetical protein
MDRSVTYVLSSHGEELNDAIRIPDNFLVHTYVPPGKPLACSLKKPTEICKDWSKAPGHYKPGSSIQNATLWPDQNTPLAFYSGVKDCATGNIAVNIDRIGQTTLRDVIQKVIEYNNIVHPGKTPHLHCLYCRDTAMQGGRRKTRKVKRGGMTRERGLRLNELEHTTQIALDDARQKGIEDAKFPPLKRAQALPASRIEGSVRILSRKHPRVSAVQLQEAYIRGFNDTRAPNPAIGGRRRKTRRGGVSKEMVDALRSAETQGRTDKQNGVSSRADAIAGSIMNQFRLADFGTPSPRTLLRDKYTASYQQTPASGLPSGMPSGLQSVVDRIRALAS